MTASSQDRRPDPRERAFTDNERAWVEFIRLISHDTDPAPTLWQVQQLRQVIAKTAGNRRR